MSSKLNQIQKVEWKICYLKKKICIYLWINFLQFTPCNLLIWQSWPPNPTSHWQKCFPIKSRQFPFMHVLFAQSSMFFSHRGPKKVYMNKWRGVTISFRTGGQGRATPIHTLTPLQTLKHTHKVFKNAPVPTFRLMLMDGLTDGQSFL